MVYDIKDKVVIITGAANGVGAGVVRMIVQEGAKHVAILDIAETAGKALQNELNATHGAGKVKFHQCNVINEEDLLGALRSVKKEYGYVDVLINNAGIMNDSLKALKNEVLINVLALITGSIEALHLMRKDEGGRGGTIINISSVAALCQLPFLPVYWATKSAVLQFSMCLGMEEYYSRTGVRVLTICFGPTDTALLTEEKLGTFDPSLEKMFIDISKKTKSQKMESAAKGVIEMYRHGESGSTWLATKDEPAKDISGDIKKAYDVLSKHAFS